MTYTLLTLARAIAHHKGWSIEYAIEYVHDVGAQQALMFERDERDRRVAEYRAASQRRERQ